MNTDMTKYCFQHFENAYNIGWKNNHKSSKQEDYGKEFIEKLKVFCQYPVNKDLNGKFRYLDAKEGGKCVTGFGEIRIIDIKNNITSGDIYYVEKSTDTKNIKILINSIIFKDLDIISLSKMLSEEID